MSATVRRARPVDAAALVELRATMFAALGDDLGAADAAWRDGARRWLEARLDGDRLAAFLAEEPGSGPVACAIGVLEERPPSPGDASGERGHVFQVCTLPGHRRRGHARACLLALLDWFDTATGTRSVDLHATGEGEPLYRSLGFEPRPYPAMRRTRPSPPANDVAR